MKWPTPMPKCAACATPITPRNRSGMCKPCNLAAINARPSMVEVRRRNGLAQVADIPAHLREDYRFLRHVKRLTAAESRMALYLSFQPREGGSA